MLLRRRMYGKSGGLLPNIYQRVEYIQNEVGSYIDTNLSPSAIKNNPIVIAKFQMITLGDKDWFGTNINGGHLIFDVRSTDGFPFIRWGRTNYSNSFTPQIGRALLFTDAPHTVKLYGTDTLYIDVDGTSTYEQTPHYTTNFNTSQHIYIGKARPNNDTSSKWYSFILADGEIEKFNGIPCYVKSSGEAGMYDIVSQTFFGNAGSASIIAGPDVN